jgi:membrane peptidoglycan carboxypeptidase
VTRRPKRKPTRGERFRKALKVVLVLGVVGILFAAAAFFVLYQAIEIPDRNEDFETQTTFVYYDDGKSEVGRYAEQNRVSIPLRQMPEHLQDAVVAAENRTFWTDRGIDPKGILRAAFSNAQGNATQGASTITQQYVKILYLTTERSLTRKAKEAIVSLKIHNQMSKEEILQGYLNTIYFGRGAYGVEAAAQAYFDKPARELTVRESAVLATVLNNPTAYDPANGKEARRDLMARYQYVFEGMADMGTLDAAKAEKAAKRLPKFPEVEVESQLGGQKGHMLALVKDELLDLGFSEEEIEGGGLRVTTTFQQKAMSAAQQGVLEQRPTKQSDKFLHMAAASVEPGTGALRGFFAGQDYLESQINWAEAGGMAGSTMKPFAVATALEEGYALEDTFDGNSPYELPDGTEMENQGDADYGQVSITEATKNSINTAFIDLTTAIPDGPDKIVETMNDAGIPPAQAPRPRQAWGIPTSSPGLEPITGVALGNATVSPINMANAYATLAAGGERADVHVIEKVVDQFGETRYSWKQSTERAIDEDVAADTTYAMQQVVTADGTGSRATELGRPAIGKTGTATKDGGAVSSSWFAGATPQLATAVMMVRDKGQGALDEIVDDGGYWVGDSFAGGYYPAMTWTAIMQRAMEGLPVEEFPEPVFLDGEAPEEGHEYVPPPPPSTTQAPTTTPSPTQTQSTTKSPTQEPTTTKPSPTETEPTTEEPTTSSPSPTFPTTSSTPPPEDGGGGGNGGGGGGGGGGDRTATRRD